MLFRIVISVLADPPQCFWFACGLMEKIIAHPCTMIPCARCQEQDTCVSDNAWVNVSLRCLRIEGSVTLFCSVRNVLLDNLTPCYKVFPSNFRYETRRCTRLLMRRLLCRSVSDSRIQFIFEAGGRQDVDNNDYHPAIHPSKGMRFRVCNPFDQILLFTDTSNVTLVKSTARPACT